jgi:hypothetical protein
VSSAQISIMLTHQLTFDDLTSFRQEIIKLFSLQIIRHRSQLEYRYA